MKKRIISLLLAAALARLPQPSMAADFCAAWA